MNNIKVCAVIPLFNEEKTAALTIGELIKCGYFDAIVVVDDGSTDRTWDIISSIDGIIKARHSRNLGKAEAVYNGVDCFNADIYVFIDGDLGYSAANIYPIVDMVLNDECDMCIAALPEKKGSGGVGFLRWFSKYMVKKYTGVDFTCPLSGQRAVKADILHDMRIRRYHGFALEVGMLIDSLLSGYRIKYINCDLTHNTTGKDVKGYIHRFQQFIDILKVFIRS